MRLEHVSTYRYGRVRYPEVGYLELGFVGAAVLAVAAGGYALAGGRTPLAFAVAMLPLVAWLVTHPTVPLVLLGASIPALYSLSGFGSYHVSVSDLLLVLVGAGILLHAATTESAPAVLALRPVALPFSAID